MTDNPQPGNTSGADDLDQVQVYQKLVLEYEALDEAVDSLLAEHRGAAENMSEDDRKRYRDLARQRDEVYNQMKALESQILLDDESNNEA